MKNLLQIGIQRVCLYLKIPQNKIIKIKMHMTMFVTSLLNFILGYKMFLEIEKFFQRKWWE